MSHTSIVEDDPSSIHCLVTIVSDNHIKNNWYLYPLSSELFQGAFQVEIGYIEANTSIWKLYFKSDYPIWIDLDVVLKLSIHYMLACLYQRRLENEQTHEYWLQCAKRRKRRDGKPPNFFGISLAKSLSWSCSFFVLLSLSLSLSNLLFGSHGRQDSLQWMDGDASGSSCWCACDVAMDENILGSWDRDSKIVSTTSQPTNQPALHPLRTEQGVKNTCVLSSFLARFS